VALAGTVAVCMWRPGPPVVIVPGDGPTVCAAMNVMAATVFADRTPPPDASGDVLDALVTVNAELETIRRQIEEVCRG
jgi:hypothetical protein